MFTLGGHSRYPSSVTHPFFTYPHQSKYTSYFLKQPRCQFQFHTANRDKSEGDQPSVNFHSDKYMLQV